MTDFIIVLALVALTAFMAFIAGFAFCDWGYREKARQDRDDLMWEAVEWD